MQIECKMVHYQNHRRFSLRCLSEDLILVSIKLKVTLEHLKANILLQ